MILRFLNGLFDRFQDTSSGTQTLELGKPDCSLGQKIVYDKIKNGFDAEGGARLLKPSAPLTQTPLWFIGPVQLRCRATQSKTSTNNWQERIKRFTRQKKWAQRSVPNQINH
jgi:hypothetical protein